MSQWFAIAGLLGDTGAAVFSNCPIAGQIRTVVVVDGNGRKIRQAIESGISFDDKKIEIEFTEQRAVIIKNACVMLGFLPRDDI